MFKLKYPRNILCIRSRGVWFLSPRHQPRLSPQLCLLCLLINNIHLILLLSIEQTSIRQKGRSMEHFQENVDTQNDFFPHTMFLLLCLDFTFKSGFKWFKRNESINETKWVFKSDGRENFFNFQILWKSNEKANNQIRRAIISHVE